MKKLFFACPLPAAVFSTEVQKNIPSTTNLDNGWEFVKYIDTTNSGV
ncbi:MAG: hypothetical protein ACRYFB_08345 [Janthinobacterium lividum]